MNNSSSKEESKSLAAIFRYADWIDVLLMVLGTIGSVGDGMSTNWLLVFACRFMNNLGYGKTTQNNGNFMIEVEKVICTLFIYLGLAVLVVCFMANKTSERQVLRIRYKYLESILRQEVGFFDSQEATTSEIINNISKDTSLIQEVLSGKFPLIILLIIPGIIYGKYLLHLSKKSHKEYNKANMILEQALSSIKT
ncbi:hypothetical protein MKX03_000046, partial [Papaver bracteatum]